MSERPASSSVVSPPGATAREEVEARYRALCARPSDIDEHLPTLRWYAGQCERVTELGVRTVVSTLALLAAAPRRLHCYDLHRHPNVAEMERLAPELGVEFRFFSGDVRTLDIEPTDLLFIDTFHQYDQLQAELARHGARAGRFIILHDTMIFGWKGQGGQNAQGLLSAIHEFLYTHREWRIVESFPNNHGLTVLGKGPGWEAARGRPRQHGVRRDGRTLGYEALLDRPETIFADPPKLGLVIGTYSSLPFIHLQLEARRRFYPDLPMLVHDDASDRQAELGALCAEYGVDFETNLQRYGHQTGDLSALLGGLQWARERNVDLLVKLSRRFVPTVDWRPELLALAMESQYPTYSSWTRLYSFGFRSECLAAAVRPWFEAGAVADLAHALWSPGVGLIEAFVHNLARKTASRRCHRALAFDQQQGFRPPEISGYAIWPYLGFDRQTRSPGYLWYNFASPAEYAALAQRWGLACEAKHFAGGEGKRGDTVPAN